MEILQTYHTCSAVRLLFSENELVPIWNEVNEMIDSDFKNAKSYNNILAGNIEKEFKLLKSHEHIENLFNPILRYHIKSFGYVSNELNVLSRNAPFYLDSCWVNFQKKHEFNPFHWHLGVFSFVIWLKVPFFIEKELEMPFCKNSRNPLPGHFEFLYVNQESGMLRIKPENIGVDKRFENQGIFFPSHLMHGVYPFSSSDDYRISVSGNFKIKI